VRLLSCCVVVPQVSARHMFVGSFRGNLRAIDRDDLTNIQVSNRTPPTSTST
jgi:hypothetical protein